MIGKAAQTERWQLVRHTRTTAASNNNQLGSEDGEPGLPSLKFLFSTFKHTSATLDAPMYSFGSS